MSASRPARPPAPSSRRGAPPRPDPLVVCPGFGFEKLIYIGFRLFALSRKYLSRFSWCSRNQIGRVHLGRVYLETLNGASDVLQPWRQREVVPLDIGSTRIRSARKAEPRPACARAHTAHPVHSAGTRTRAHGALCAYCPDVLRAFAIEPFTYRI